MLARTADWPRSIATPLAAVWVAAIILDAAFLTRRGLNDMRQRAEQVRRAEAHVRAYLIAPRIEELSAATAQIAHPWAERLGSLLDDPMIRSILPAGIRPALRIEPEAESTFALQQRADGQRVWSSENGDGNMRSRLIRATLPLVRFELRGRPRKDLTLTFRDETTGRENGATFSANGSNEWRTAYAEVPTEFRIIARDERPGSSIAFTEPKEVGRLSMYAERVLGRSFHIVAAGFALAAAVAMSTAIRAARN